VLNWNQSRILPASQAAKAGDSMNNRKILVVDDEAPMRKLIEIYLCQHDYLVKSVSSGDEAISTIRKDSVDLIILDVMMPGMDGWETCRQIRQFSDVSIMMLTARDETMDKVKGLNLGADDYLIKPFEEIELVARIEALLRRTGKTANKHSTMEHKGVTIDLSARTVFCMGSELELTPKEFELLQTFITNLGRTYSRDQLLELIWGLDYLGDIRTVDSHVKNLREKLRKNGIETDEVIKTVWGVGYKGI
jgi:two-component system, OmpR family, response regulator ResD